MEGKDNEESEGGINGSTQKKIRKEPASNRRSALGSAGAATALSVPRETAARCGKRAGVHESVPANVKQPTDSARKTNPK